MSCKSSKTWLSWLRTNHDNENLIFILILGRVSPFPMSGKGNFSLQYKDSEGDFVSFSSNEELMDALAQINDGVFRLFVKASGDLYFAMWQGVVLNLSWL